MMYFGWGWMMLWMVLFWAGLIFLIVWGIKKLTERSEGKKNNPMDIARDRYARGEITKQQFEDLKKDLSS